MPWQPLGMGRRVFAIVGLLLLLTACHGGSGEDEPGNGKTTDAEKEVVRNNLDKINERLERDGLRTIRLDDAEMVARYGLEALAKEAGYLL